MLLRLLGDINRCEDGVDGRKETNGGGSARQRGVLINRSNQGRPRVSSSMDGVASILRVLVRSCAKTPDGLG